MREPSSHKCYKATTQMKGLDLWFHGLMAVGRSWGHSFCTLTSSVWSRAKPSGGFSGLNQSSSHSCSQVPSESGTQNRRLRIMLHGRGYLQVNTGTPGFSCQLCHFEIRELRPGHCCVLRLKPALWT